MKDITTMKLKKSIEFKDLPKNSLKTPKLKTSLPYNKGIKNIMDITHGIPKGKGFSKHFNFKFNNSLDTKDIYKLKNTDNTGLYKLKGRMSNPMRNKNFPLPTMGRTRIKQQKGLTPWGDYDGDKVINMLDCNPRNKNLQGPEHSMEDKMNPSDELRRDYEADTTNTPIEYSQGVIEYVEEPRTEKISESKYDKELEKRKKEIEALDIQEKQKRLALLRRQQEEREADIKSKRKELEALEKKKKVLGTTSKAKKAIQPISGAVSTISQASTGFGGFGVSQQGILGATSTNASQYKILRALGKEPPVQYQQPVSQVQQAQAQPDTTVVSPYSKRKVSYVRGPYKKG